MDALLVFDPNLAAALPALTGPAARLANWLDGPNFPAVRAAISKRWLRLSNCWRLRRNSEGS